MATVHRVLKLVLALAVHSSQWPYVDARFEDDLRAETFARSIGHDSAALILFTESGPKCRACPDMLDKWPQLGDKYEESKKMLIGIVDCAGLSKLCAAHNVTTTPQVVLYGIGQSEGTALYGSSKSVELSTLLDAANSLLAECDARAPDSCTESQQAELAPFFEMPPGKLLRKLRLLESKFNTTQHTAVTLTEEYARMSGSDESNPNKLAKRFATSAAQMDLKTMIDKKYQTLRRLSAVFAAKGSVAALAPDDLAKVYASINATLFKSRKEKKKKSGAQKVADAFNKAWKGATKPAPPREEL